jgi:hypothetical protein
MTIQDDTEWLRAQLKLESFHYQYNQKWVAVRDNAVVYSGPLRDSMQQWLDLEDPNGLCVLAFCDARVLV